MKKHKNVFVLVKRLFMVDGSKVLKDVLKHIEEINKKEIINCPECLERVRNHNDHYEHFSAKGRACSFKVKTT